jgi:hypothetical protein
MMKRTFTPAQKQRVNPREEQKQFVKKHPPTDTRQPRPALLRCAGAPSAVVDASLEPRAVRQ